MNDLLSQTVSIKSLIAVLAVVAGILLSGTTLYWTTEMREALEAERNAADKRKVMMMSNQLNRIEVDVRSLKAGIQALKVFHHGPN